MSRNYYIEIKDKLINKEIYNRVKDYSKNKNDLMTYYEVGKLLSEAGKHYGEGIIKQYSNKLIIDINKKYNERTLRRIRQFYKMCNEQNWSPVATNLTWSHYVELLPMKDINKINYYINISTNQRLSRNELREKIKNQEYERLDNKTKEKLRSQEEIEVTDFVKNPIIIKSNLDHDKISEKVLQQLILEDMSHFLKELGSGFCYIDNEYKIKLGNRYNYIDLLLFNIEFNCYIVIELKVTGLKAEHIGQITKYMHYIDKNMKKLNQNKTIGIIICKKGKQSLTKRNHLLKQQICFV